MIMKAMAYLDQFDKGNPLSLLLTVLATARGIRLVPEKIKEFSQSAQVFPVVTPIPENEIDKVINDQIVFKRTLRKDGKNAAIYNHSKVVLVDDHLMYVGSDTIYPAYCAEHGIWVDDQQAIKTWKENVFKELWDRSYDA